MMDKKGSFILYTRYAEFSADLSDEDFGRLMRAVFAYEEFKTMPENLPPMAMVLFRVIKSDLDMNAQKYAETCEKRREAGKKGGRPKKEEEIEEETENQTKAKKANGFSENQTKAKKADNEYDNEDEDEYEDDYEYEDEDDNDDVSSASAAHEAYEELIGDLTPRTIDILDSFDLLDELKVKAIEEAHDNNKKSISYIKAILDRFVKAKILTIEDWEKAEARRNAKSTEPLSHYDFDEIERLAIEQRMRKKGDKNA